MTHRRTALPLPSLLTFAALAVTLLGARPASACRSNEECKSPRICAMGACVNPPESNAPHCVRDIDCGGEDICEANRCVPMISKMPGESTMTPPESSPPLNQDSGPPQPGLEITPHKSTPPPEGSTQPAPAAPPAAPPPASTPPPPARPPRPPPVATIPAPPDAPPPPPTSPYFRRPPRRVMPPRFDAFVGGGYWYQQNELRLASALGIAVDAQFLFGIIPELALGLRGGGIIEPGSAIVGTSLYYVAPGIYVPVWHMGFYAGYANGAVSPKDRRLSGFTIEAAYEYSLAPFLKLGFAIGFNGFPAGSRSASGWNGRFELGF